MFGECSKRLNNCKAEDPERPDDDDDDDDDDEDDDVDDDDNRVKMQL